MKALGGVSLPSLPISGLKHIRDLINFDGPLLSQYAHASGDNYLYYWCDCDSEANRWMILRVSEASIIRLVNRFVPLDYVIPRGCRDDYVYVADIADDSSVSAVTMLRVQDIPLDYRPTEGTYLPSESKGLADHTYAVVVEGSWTVWELGEFPSKFAKIYSLLYALNVLKLPQLDRFPWRGGFSSMYFFNWAAHSIPSEDRPIVSAMQYASPGFMRFSLHGGTAEQVTLCVRREGDVSIKEAYIQLSEYIRANKLNDILYPDDSRWESHNQHLADGAAAIMRGFRVIDADVFLKTCHRPFEAAKISMTFYRYINDLIKFERDGLVRFPAADPN